MDIETYANTILFGNTLADKLTLAPANLDFSQALRGPIRTPDFPGRPLWLASPGKSIFPPIERLHETSVRGEILHFFANHELLALELMALILLRFPEAPESFRKGLVRTLSEEQTHLSLYLGRMKDFGVEFGDLPVSDYFWKALRNVQSPLEYVTQMSLTLEQANLDYAASFAHTFAGIEDLKTSTILERVLKDEIGHVRHGLTWFNRWRDASTGETEWDAYLRLLPAPMTPRRARGTIYCESARRDAGLSETFIRELSLCGGSKGHPPTVWLYNPHCDQEIARGTPGFSPTGGAQRLSEDLDSIPLFLTSEQDTLLVRRRPDSEWIASLQALGFRTPEIIELSSPQELPSTLRTPKIGGIEPWGWSPDVFGTFQALQERLVETPGGNTPWSRPLLGHLNFKETGVGPLFSKSWSTRFLQDRGGALGNVYTDESSAHAAIESLLAEGRWAMAKAPFGTSGMQNRQIRNRSELKGPIGGWIRNTIAEQKEIVIEPWLDKITDLSMQIEVEGRRIRLLEVRKFITGPHGEYRGTFLGRSRPGFTAPELRLLHTVKLDWEGLVRDLGERLRAEGYQGPAGIDAMIWKDGSGELRFRPFVELNPRWTMGRVALELEKHLIPGVTAVWAFIPLRELRAGGYANKEEFVDKMKTLHAPQSVLRGTSRKIESGVVFTNDPSRAQEVLTVLATLPNSEIEALLKIEAPLKIDVSDRP